MPFDLSSQQLNVWMAVSTRPDLTLILLTNPNNYTPQETQFLQQVGINTTDRGVQQMISAAAGYKDALAGTAGLFHAILQATLGRPYPPPNCPANAQLHCLGGLQCIENQAESELNAQIAALMVGLGPVFPPPRPSQPRGRAGGDK